jgi:chromate reductase, NAD(P)H dehydrogenase (quinone)
MKIIAFAGSNSTGSINKKLVTYCVSFFDSTSTEILDLNDFEMPIYSIEREAANGIPALAIEFASKIDSADSLVISLAEYNGSYSTAFKNIFDWISRIPNRKAFGGKPTLLMATSPGARGGSTVLETAKNSFPRSGAEVLETFSLTSFNENFSIEDEIINEQFRNELMQKIENVKLKINH